MTVNTSCEVVGVRDAIRALNKVEPGLRKQFTNDAKEIAAPAIQHVQESYADAYLSGMARVWTDKERKVFPYNVLKARKGVKFKIDARRESLAVIQIQQADPGTAIFETAGRKTNNRLGLSLGPLKPAHTRVLGPAVYRRRRQVEDAMRRLALKAVETVNKELR